MHGMQITLLAVQHQMSDQLPFWLLCFGLEMHGVQQRMPDLPEHDYLLLVRTGILFHEQQVRNRMQRNRRIPRQLNQYLLILQSGLLYLLRQYFR